jgi:cell division septation protein DedD
MHEDVDEQEVTRDDERRDTEVTLGPGLLLGIFFGLVILCGFCFGLGYSLGSRGGGNTHESSAGTGQQSAVVAGAGLSAADSPAKPSAAPLAASQPQSTAVSQPAADASGAATAAPSSDAAAAQAAGVNTAEPAVAPAQPVVKPALPDLAPSASAPANLRPAPAFGGDQTVALMVQIASVSRQEDADVLVGALRRRGYAVTVSRDAADHQFHVRVGPFSNRNDANAMRRKLLGDGYNAVVQP